MKSSIFSFSQEPRRGCQGTGHKSPGPQAPPPHPHFSLAPSHCSPGSAFTCHHVSALVFVTKRKEKYFLFPCLSQSGKMIYRRLK